MKTFTVQNAETNGTLTITKKYYSEVVEHLYTMGWTYWRIITENNVSADIIPIK